MTKCKHLVKLPSGKTLCRIYKTHKGTVIDRFDDKIVDCIDRSDRKEPIEGCPYNKEETDESKRAVE